MEYGQPWVPQRPSARPGVGFRPNPPIGSQRIQQPNGTGQNGISSLSREERQEAKRLAEEANFSFAGYQVVRREFISHRFDPAMTIRGNSITFNNSCISKLEDATSPPYSRPPNVSGMREVSISSTQDGRSGGVMVSVTFSQEMYQVRSSCH